MDGPTHFFKLLSCSSAQRAACLQMGSWEVEMGQLRVSTFRAAPQGGRKAEDELSWVNCWALCAGWSSRDCSPHYLLLLPGTRTKICLLAHLPILTFANPHHGFLRNPRNSIFNFQIWFIGNYLGMCAGGSVLQTFTPVIIHTHGIFTLKLGLITHKVLLPQMQFIEKKTFFC